VIGHKLSAIGDQLSANTLQNLPKVIPVSGLSTIAVADLWTQAFCF
jgi:hypothetical protein